MPISCSSSSSSFGGRSTAEQVTQGIDASNLTAIVTGASSGIGIETARVLALRGAQVVLAVRNVTAGENVKENILKETGSAGRLHVLELDLSSLQSVRSFCQNFLARNLPLNILVNNAGIMACPFALSADGIELQFATNHVGHFLLTNLLLDKMKSTAKETGIQGRIVSVSSWGHALFTYPGGIRFDKLNDESSYSAERAYGQSKLANILHAKELARRFEEEGVNLTANALHPGLFKSSLTRNSTSFMRWMETIFVPFVGKSVPQGAATQCLLALHPSINNSNGKFFDNCKESKPSAKACDPQLGKESWDFTERLIAMKI